MSLAPPMTGNGWNPNYLWWWLGDGFPYCYTYITVFSCIILHYKPSIWGYPIYENPHLKRMHCQNQQLTVAPPSEESRSAVAAASLRRWRQTAATPGSLANEKPSPKNNPQTTGLQDCNDCTKNRQPKQGKTSRKTIDNRLMYYWIGNKI